MPISALRVPPHRRSTHVELAGPCDTRPTLFTQGMISQSALHCWLPVIELSGVWPCVLPERVNECVRLFTAGTREASQKTVSLRFELLWLKRKL